MSRREMYVKYIQSPEWAARRDVVLKARGDRCQSCRSSFHLHVHHQTYVRLGHEADGDLVVLCEKCHDLVHRLHKTHKNVSLLQATNVVLGKAVLPINHPKRRSNTSRNPNRRRKPKVKTDVFAEAASTGYVPKHMRDAVVVEIKGQKRLRRPP